jgi:hypothetical protein
MSYRETEKKVKTPAQLVFYSFADDLKVTIKGAELVSVEVYSSNESAFIIVKGTVTKNQPTPTPTPRPTVPNTGVEDVAGMGLANYISLFGGVVALAALRNKKTVIN